MAHVAVLYGTTEGQTAKIAQAIAAQGRTAGHEVDVLHIGQLDEAFDPSAYDAAIVGASVHEGKHQRYVDRFVERHREWLDSHPSAFFSVALCQASGDAEGARQAQELVMAFVQRTGWKPARTATFAGALKYLEYNWLKRMLMKHIVARAGGDTDTSRDYEYTDWEQVEAFAREFFESLPQSER